MKRRVLPSLDKVRVFNWRQPPVFYLYNMKVSELIVKLQKLLETSSDKKVKCELRSTNKWLSEKEPIKDVYGHLGIKGNNIIIFV